MVRPIRHILAIVIVYLFAVVPSRAIDPPAWWNDPIKEDAANYFFTASGVSETGSDDALRIAQNNALEQIVARLGGSSSPAIHDYLLASIRNWKIHAKDERAEGRSHHVWIIVKFPKDEYASVEDLISGGPRRYQEAVVLVGNKKYAEAMGVLDELIRKYPIKAQPVLNTQDALLLGADCAGRAGKHKSAMDYYQQILNLGTDHPLYERARQGFLEAQKNYDPIMDGMAQHKGRTFAAFAEIVDGGGQAKPVGTGAIAETLTHYGMVDKTREVTGESVISSMFSSDAKLPLVDFVLLCRIKIGEPTERSAWGTTLKVFPATCEIEIVERKGGIVSRNQKTQVLEASDRHGGKEAIYQIAIKGCASSILAEMQTRR